jgi:chemotaxis methyl-accepting protein methylase
MDASGLMQQLPKPEMTDEEFQQFRDTIYLQTHIYCADSQRPLFERKIRARLKTLQIGSFGEYYQRIVDPQDGESELTRLIDIIAVHETSFFRLADHFTALQEIAFPAWHQSPERSPLNIWSAGCSTGEEPYSIAMTFLEYIARKKTALSKPRAIEIFATDIAPSAIQNARQGYYSLKQVQKIPQALLDKYFIRYDDQYHITNEVKQLITFRVANLVHLTTYPKRSFHIIFCRNVLIYFDRHAQETLLHALMQRLAENGYLCLGDAESIHVFPDISRSLQLMHVGNSIIYQKYGVLS